MITLTSEGSAALTSGATAPEAMLPATSYAISGTDPDGYTRVVTRNITRHDHATATINSLAASGWSAIDLYPEGF